MEKIIISGTLLLATFTLGYMASVFISNKNNNLRLFVILYVIFYFEKISTLVNRFYVQIGFTSQTWVNLISLSGYFFDLLFVLILVLFIKEIFQVSLLNKIIPLVLLYSLPWITDLFVESLNSGKSDIALQLWKNLDSIPMYLFILYLGFTSYKKINLKEVRELGKTTLIIISVTLFIIINDGFLESFLSVDIPKESIIVVSFSLMAIYYSFLFLKFNKKAITMHDEVLSENYGITKREKEIILLLVKGESYKSIAEQLYISHSTVKTHIHNVYRKMDINSRHELVNMIYSHL